MSVAADAGPPLAHPSTLAASVDRIGETAKWLIAALGATATVLVAGSQLADLGKLTVPSTRFVFAVVGLTFALTSVLVAIWAASRVLTPTRFGLDRLASSAARQVGESYSDYRERAKELVPIREFLDRQPDLFLGYAESIAQLASKRSQAILALQQSGDGDTRQPDASVWERTAHELAIRREQSALRDELTGLDATARQVVEIAHYELARRRLRTAVRVLLVVGLIGAIGMSVFAWASHPSHDHEEPLFGEVVLTPVGKTTFSDVLSPKCLASPIHVLVRGATGGDGVELLAMPVNGCVQLAFTLTSALGVLVESQT